MQKRSPLLVVGLLMACILLMPAAAAAYTVTFVQDPSPVKHGENVSVLFTVDGIDPNTHVKMQYSSPMTWSQWYATINPGYTFTDPPYLVRNLPESGHYYSLFLARLVSSGVDWPYIDANSFSYTLNIEHEYANWAYNGTNHWHACVCGLTNNVEAHTMAVTAVVPPTCTQGGYTRHTCTAGCGYYYDDNIVSALGHIWGNWAHDIATTGVTSTHSRTCSRDTNHTETVGCTFNNAVIQPTCTESGYTTHTCTICGYNYTDNQVAALGHSWSAWTHDSASGETSTHSRVCANNQSHTETEGCAFNSVVTPPACIKGGYTTHTCTVCGYTYADTPVAALGHSWSAWVHVGSSFGRRSTHSQICSRNTSHRELRVCTFSSVVTPPTCTEKGYTTHTCTGCGYSYKDASTAALGHAWRNWAHDAATAGSASTHSRICYRNANHKETESCTFNSLVTPPTCTEGGYTIHTCSRCKYSYMDTSEALGHAWSDWSHDAASSDQRSTHSRICSNNTSHREVEACTFISVVTPPSFTEGGYTTYTCTICGYSFKIPQ